LKPPTAAGYDSLPAFPQGCSVTLILASTSAIRRQMLDSAGVAYEAVRPQVDEAELKRGMTNPCQVARQLAEAKALSIGGEWVIGSDSVVTVDLPIPMDPVSASLIMPQAAPVREARRAREATASQGS
jgi:hypothetical protein